MLTKIVEALVYLGTPTRWSIAFRRLFVVFCPITIPMLILFWTIFMAIVVVGLLIGFFWCILMELANSMLDLWREKRFH